MSTSLGVFASGVSGHLSIGFSSIATVTAAGGETSLTFSSIPQTYTDLQIRWTARSAEAATTSTISMTINGDSASHYATHTLEANQTTINATGNASQGSAYLFGWTNNYLVGNSAAAGIFNSGIIDFSDYTSTTKNKTMRAITGLDENVSTAGLGAVVIGSSVWLSTAAITSVSILGPGGSGFKAGTTFALYGIKGFA